MTAGGPRLTILVSLIAWGAVVAAHRWSTAAGAADPPGGRAAVAERRALDFLAREVPRWKRENHCFSCHNNGDAARALLAARAKGMSVPGPALDDTIAFLARPELWDRNGVDAAFSDKKLARLQFACALAALWGTGAGGDRPSLLVAARRLAQDQADDGSWKVDEGALVGSPATYGPPLATAAARVVLTSAGRDEFAPAIDRADRWLLGRPVRNVLDASAVLLGVGLRGDAAEARRASCVEFLRKAQAQDGGWGPFSSAPPETFDTAIALLALCAGPDRKAVAPMVERGRAYLVRNQADDGSWPETTRPSGGESYAQRLSTTGWALQALLATDP